MAKVHVRLSTASSQPVTASYSTEDVTATGGKDYQSEVAGSDHDRSGGYGSSY